MKKLAFLLTVLVFAGSCAQPLIPSQNRTPAGTGSVKVSLPARAAWLSGGLQLDSLFRSVATSRTGVTARSLSPVKAVPASRAFLHGAKVTIAVQASENGVWTDVVEPQQFSVADSARSALPTSSWTLGGIPVGMGYRLKVSVYPNLSATVPSVEGVADGVAVYASSITASTVTCLPRVSAQLDFTSLAVGRDTLDLPVAVVADGGDEGLGLYSAGETWVAVEARAGMTYTLPAMDVPEGTSVTVFRSDGKVLRETVAVDSSNTALAKVPAVLPGSTGPVVTWPLSVGGSFAAAESGTYYLGFSYDTTDYVTAEVDFPLTVTESHTVGTAEVRGTASLPYPVEGVDTIIMLVQVPPASDGPVVAKPAWTAVQESAVTGTSVTYDFGNVPPGQYLLLCVADTQGTMQESENSFPAGSLVGAWGFTSVPEPMSALINAALTVPDWGTVVADVHTSVYPSALPLAVTQADSGAWTPGLLTRAAPRQVYRADVAGGGVYTVSWDDSYDGSGTIDYGTLGDDTMVSIVVQAADGTYRSMGPSSGPLLESGSGLFFDSGYSDARGGSPVVIETQPTDVAVFVFVEPWDSSFFTGNTSFNSVRFSPTDTVGFAVRVDQGAVPPWPAVDGTTGPSVTSGS